MKDSKPISSQPWKVFAIGAATAAVSILAMVVAVGLAGPSRHRITDLGNGVEISKVSVFGEREGESLTYTGYLSMRQTFRSGSLVESIGYTPEGDVLWHTREGAGFAMEPVE